jgi:hypothetical protein
LKILNTFSIFVILALLSFSLFSFKKMGIVQFKLHIKALGKILGYLILLSNFIDFLFLAYSFYNNWSEIISYPHCIPNGEGNNLPMDPVRWYPSGVPQGIGVVGGGLDTYAALSRMGKVPLRIRVFASL